jgi:hypothetical protein
MRNTKSGEKALKKWIRPNPVTGVICQVIVEVMLVQKSPKGMTNKILE